MSYPFLMKSRTRLSSEGTFNLNYRMTLFHNSKISIQDIVLPHFTPHKVGKGKSEVRKWAVILTCSLHRHKWDCGTLGIVDLVFSFRYEGDVRGLLWTALYSLYFFCVFLFKYNSVFLSNSPERVLFCWLFKKHSSYTVGWDRESRGQKWENLQFVMTQPQEEEFAGGKLTPKWLEWLAIY